MSKVLLISTHFDDNLEIATIPWLVSEWKQRNMREISMV
jgi:hypothetical protein